MAKKTTRTNVSALDFAKAVKEVSDAEGSHVDIAAKVGLAVGSVATRLCNLRKRGVNVPNFKRGGGGGARLDIAALNDIFAG